MISLIHATLATHWWVVLLVGGAIAIVAGIVWRMLKRVYHKVIALAMVPSGGMFAGGWATIQEYVGKAHHAGMSVMDYINLHF